MFGRGCRYLTFGILALILTTGNCQQETIAAEEPKIRVPNMEEEKNETKPVLTGNPQIDYIHDPNLPFQLEGYDLSDYPFYQRVPNVKFNFTCDGRLDGFYASIPHKCQVYHNCLFGVRYDFICPNYTAFDQTHFICHFASAVDCKNSELYYHRNEILYVEATTTTTKAPEPIIKIVYVDRPRPSRPRKRPKPKPAETEYYYYDDETPANAPAQKQQQKQQQPVEYYEYYDYEEVTTRKPPTTTTTPPPPPIRTRFNRPLRTRPGALSGTRNTQRLQSTNRKPPALPDYDFESQPPQRPNNNRKVQRRRRKKKKKVTTTTTAAPEYEYEYYDYVYDEDVVATTTSTTTQAPAPLRRRRPTRFTAKDRQAHLKTRKQQLLNANRRKPVPISRLEPLDDPVPNPREPEPIPQESFAPESIRPRESVPNSREPVVPVPNSREPVAPEPISPQEPLVDETFSYYDDAPPTLNSDRFATRDELNNEASISQGSLNETPRIQRPRIRTIPQTRRRRPE